MRKPILEYYVKINAPYLHAYAEAGTEFLLDEMHVNTHETILEIGVGTGGTLVKIKSRNPTIKLFGVDASQAMCQKSKSRLVFCGIKDVTPLLNSHLESLPFKDETFDKIYAESVFAIQNDETLVFLLKEIYRLLKQGGNIYLSESVWLPNIDKEEIEIINANCKHKFGIIQSNSKYPYRQNWENLLTDYGFKTIKTKLITPANNQKVRNKKEYLSRLFTIIGKIKAYRPKLYYELKGHQKNMNSIYKNKKYLEGVLFQATK